MGQAPSEGHGCCSESNQPDVEHVEALPKAVVGRELDTLQRDDKSVGSLRTSRSSPRVDLTTSTLAHEQLRGIPLQKTLRNAGSLWLHKPADLKLEERMALYDLSEPVSKLDIFISHTWRTPGKWKFLSLLLQSGWKSMLLAWAAGTSLSAVLLLLDVLPPLFDVYVTASEEAVAASCWVILACWPSTIAGLLAAPYMPSCKSEMCFVDVACIHQADPVLLQQGIDSIGSFLAAARELRVLWSEPYLTSLWCIFELAAYRKVNPTGRISLTPLFMEVIVVEIFTWIFVLSCLWWLSRSTLEITAVWFGSVVLAAICLGFAFVSNLRHRTLSRSSLISGLEHFSVSQVTCEHESDKKCIHSAIVDWYGSLEAFDEEVRGPFRINVLEPLQRSSFSFGYICLLTTPVVNVILEGMLAFVKAGKPWQSIATYAASYLFGLAVLWFPAVLTLLVFMCEQGTLQSSVCKRHLQTIGIVVATVFLSLLGAAGAYASYLQGSWLVLVWMVVSLAFHMSIRRCCRRK